MRTFIVISLSILAIIAIAPLVQVVGRKIAKGFGKVYDEAEEEDSNDETVHKS